MKIKIDQHLDKILAKYKDRPGFTTLGDGCYCCAKYIAALELGRDVVLEIKRMKRRIKDSVEHILANNPMLKGHYKEDDLFSHVSGIVTSYLVEKEENENLETKISTLAEYILCPTCFVTGGIEYAEEGKFQCRSCGAYLELSTEDDDT